MNLAPYILFNGNCEEALNFYKQAFKGEIQNLSRFEGAPMETRLEDKQKVMHATFVAKGIFLMASDGGGHDGQPASDSGMVHLSVNFEDAGEMDQVFNSLSEGGKVAMPLQDTFWGAKFGMLIDRYGVKWMFNCEKAK
jgi:PhnB protein